MSTCGCKFCKKCLCANIVGDQWHNSFSTEDILYCPQCKIKLNDYDWSACMEYCVDLHLFSRKKVFCKLIEPKDIHKLNIDDINKIIKNSQVANRILIHLKYPWWYDTDVEKVYFTKTHLFNHEYVFRIDYDHIKENIEPLKEDLMKYLYHPSRISFNEID